MDMQYGHAGNLAKLAGEDFLCKPAHEGGSLRGGIL